MFAGSFSALALFFLVLTEYARIFQVPVVFGSRQNTLLTDEAWLALKTSTSSRYVFGILNSYAEALLKKLDSSSNEESSRERARPPNAGYHEWRLHLSRIR